MGRLKIHYTVLLAAALMVGCAAHQDPPYTAHVGAKSRIEAQAIRVAVRAYGLSPGEVDGYDIRVQSEAESGNVAVLISPHYEVPAGMIPLGDPTGRAIEFRISPTGQVLERIHPR